MGLLCALHAALNRSLSTALGSDTSEQPKKDGALLLLQAQHCEVPCAFSNLPHAMG